MTLSLALYQMRAAEVQPCARSGTRLSETFTGFSGNLPGAKNVGLFERPSFLLGGDIFAVGERSVGSGSAS